MRADRFLLLPVVLKYDRLPKQNIYRPSFNCGSFSSQMTRTYFSLVQVTFYSALKPEGQYNCDKNTSGVGTVHWAGTPELIIFYSSVEIQRFSIRFLYGSFFKV